MARDWNESEFDEKFDELIVHGVFNEESTYYPRYKSRYRDLLVRYSAVAPATPQDVLDVGGGQLGLLCKALWKDRAHAADIGGVHLSYLRSHGVQTAEWNLCADQQPFVDCFDFVFFSEVIEHLPIPGHIVLERLKTALKPKGMLICSTPNLYRLRNIVFMILGRQIFDHFRMPTTHGLGHVLEYSRDHLAWQIETAGFETPTITLVQMHHIPNDPVYRLMYWIGSPLFMIERYRDNLVAIARKPARTSLHSALHSIGVILKLSRPPILLRLLSGFFHRLPIMSGLTRLSFNPLMDLAFRSQKRPISARMLSGMIITVDPTDHDGRILYLFGTNDPKVQCLTDAFLSPGDVFLDIGANYSSIGLQTLDRVGADGCVHLFEPQPHLCEIVSLAISNAKLSNVRLHQIALMSKEGRMWLSKPSNHSGMATLIDQGNQDKWDKIEVQVKDIASYLPPLVAGAPFGVKVDVEGAELQVLPWLLAQANLKFLVFEASSNRVALFELVSRSGMSLYGLERAVFRKRIRKVDSVAEMNRYHDLVAIRAPKNTPMPMVANPYKLALLLST